MCHFITATLPRDARIELISAAAGRHQLAWVAIENKKVSSQLDKGSTYFYTTQGMCDCGTEFGAKCVGVDKMIPDYSSDIKSFQRKGWSATKISKWVGEKEKNMKKNERVKSAIVPGEEIERWMKFISDILENKYTTSVGVLLHTYSGDLENERIKISGRTTTILSKISKDLFLNIEEDHLYRFRPNS